MLDRPWIVSLVLFCVFVAAWHLAVSTEGGSGAGIDPEYAKLMGQSAESASNAGIPSPAAVARRALELGTNAFDRANPNNLGIAWHLLHSLGRVALGYLLAVLVAVPLGFAIGLTPKLYSALNPFIQLLKPISPLAWMPLALYALKDSGQAAIFIIFICSLWPLLINTAAGAGSVRQDWLNVARVLGLATPTKILRIVLPASVPMILTGMRISIGVAWFVIVAAEMVVGQNGIGYFIWNEWNNLQIASMIVAIVLIGFVGLLLDQALAWIGQRFSFRE
ncbi:MAG: nitrate ABC transporter, permease protein [Methylobacterium sp.]|nr:MAG: nitrate ABC transporter, permease protein [Methylobacterium sp.]